MAGGRPAAKDATMNPTLQGILTPFQRFLRLEAAGGLLLLGVTIVALVWANSPFGDAYKDVWATTFSVGIGDGALAKPLILWINDGLMAIFFLLVGLEIKRELLIGEISSPRRALLPIAAAIGGMVGPALIYVAINAGKPTIGGWGVPMATDIAFAVGVLAVLGRRVPLGLKVFLTALAIVDDLGAVAVIALFYTEEIKWNALAAGGGIFALLIVLNRLGIRPLLVYVLLGAVMWFAVLKSGVHATIAGVLIAAAIPADARVARKRFGEVIAAVRDRVFDGDDEVDTVDRAVIHELEHVCAEVQSPLVRLEHMLLPWVSFVIMPIFALANAGVDLRAFSPSDFLDPVALGIALGLFFGNQVGIVGMTWLVVRLGLGSLPEGVTWRHVHGASLLAGIGFTMSLFIASLAFPDAEVLGVAKLGILLGSLASGVAGFVVLALIGRREKS